MKRISLVILMALSLLPAAFAQETITLLCGVTMKFAVEELTKTFSEANKVKFEVSYGGSGDLQKLIQKNKVGDLFFPGTDSFIKQLQTTGEVTDTAFAGENKAGLVVAKGNPKKIQSIKDLADMKNKVVLARAASGSIGRESERILTEAGILDDVSDNVLYFTTDSKDLANAIKTGEADATINWKAAAALAENRPDMDVIDIPGAAAEKLVFGLLKYSRNPGLAKKFMQYATSAEGRAVFAKHGF